MRSVTGGTDSQTEEDDDSQTFVTRMRDVTLPRRPRRAAHVSTSELATATVFYSAEGLERRALYPWQLEFVNPDLEAAFILWQGSRRTNVRLALVLIAFTSFVFAAWDAFTYRRIRYNLWVIRLLVACASLATLAVTYTQSFSEKRTVRRVVLIVLVVGGAISVGITDFIIGNLGSYAFMILITNVYALGFLEFHDAAVTCTMLSIAWSCAAATLVHNDHAPSNHRHGYVRDPFVVIATHILPILVLNAVGIVHAYYVQRALRLAFLRVRARGHQAAFSAEAVRVHAQIADVLVPSCMEPEAEASSGSIDSRSCTGTGAQLIAHTFDTGTVVCQLSFPIDAIQSKYSTNQVELLRGRADTLRQLHAELDSLIDAYGGHKVGAWRNTYTFVVPSRVQHAPVRAACIVGDARDCWSDMVGADKSVGASFALASQTQADAIHALYDPRSRFGQISLWGAPVERMKGNAAHDMSAVVGDTAFCTAIRVRPGSPLLLFTQVAETWGSRWIVTEGSDLQRCNFLLPEFTRAHSPRPCPHPSDSWSSLPDSSEPRVSSAAPVLRYRRPVYVSSIAKFEDGDVGHEETDDTPRAQSVRNNEGDSPEMFFVQAGSTGAPSEMRSPTRRPTFLRQLANLLSSGRVPRRRRIDSRRRTVYRRRSRMYEQRLYWLRDTLWPAETTPVFWDWFGPEAASLGLPDNAADTSNGRQCAWPSTWTVAALRRREALELYQEHTGGYFASLGLLVLFYFCLAALDAHTSTIVPTTQLPGFLAAWMVQYCVPCVIATCGLVLLGMHARKNRITPLAAGTSDEHQVARISAATLGLTTLLPLCVIAAFDPAPATFSTHHVGVLALFASSYAWLFVDLPLRTATFLALGCGLGTHFLALLLGGSAVASWSDAFFFVPAFVAGFVAKNNVNRVLATAYATMGVCRMYLEEALQEQDAAALALSRTFPAQWLNSNNATVFVDDRPMVIVRNVKVLECTCPEYAKIRALFPASHGPSRSLFRALDLAVQNWAARHGWELVYANGGLWALLNAPLAPSQPEQDAQTVRATVSRSARAELCEAIMAAAAAYAHLYVDVGRISEPATKVVECTAVAVGVIGEHRRFFHVYY